MLISMDPKTQALAFEESKVWRAYSRPARYSEAIARIAAASDGNIRPRNESARRVVAGPRTPVIEIG